MLFTRSAASPKVALKCAPLPLLRPPFAFNAVTREGYSGYYKVRARESNDSSEIIMFDNDAWRDSRIRARFVSM